MSLISAVVSVLLITALSPVQGTEPLTSGVYNMGAISTPGAPIGPVSGLRVGVEPYDSNYANPIWAVNVVEYPEGFVLHFRGGNAAPSDGQIALASSYPGAFWNVTPVDGGVYTLQTQDGTLAWILGHDAPAGSPVLLTPSGPPQIGAEYFYFI